MTGLTLKRVARIMAGQSPPSSSVGDLTESGLPFLQGNAEFDAESPVPRYECDEATRVAPRGSVLVSVRAPVGAVNVADRSYGIGRGLCAVAPTEIHPRYLLWLLQQSGSWLNSLATGSTFVGISGQDLGSVPVPEPSWAKQAAIATYLDRETAQIDAFIAKNEELIRLLNERWKRLVIDAVSGATIEGVLMRDPGLRWAGAVPAGWQVGNIRRFTKMRTGHTPSRSRSEYWMDCDIPWFTLADVWHLRQGAKYMEETAEKISKLGLDNSAAELLPAGTVALSRTASVGFAGIMRKPMATSQDYWNWVPGRNLKPEYLWYQFQAMGPELDRLTAGSTHRTIYQADAGSLAILVPPIDEQDKIVRDLDAARRLHEDSVKVAGRAIDLAKERRSALISAAVTGKIDVGEVA